MDGLLATDRLLVYHTDRHDLNAPTHRQRLEGADDVVDGPLTLRRCKLWSSGAPRKVCFRVWSPSTSGLGTKTLRWWRSASLLLKFFAASPFHPDLGRIRSHILSVCRPRSPSPSSNAAGARTPHPHATGWHPRRSYQAAHR